MLPTAMAAGDVAALAGLALPEVVERLQKLCHDLLAQAAGAAPRFFEPASLPKPPTLMVLQAWAKELMQTARTVEHPFGAALTLEAWLARTRQALSHSPTGTHTHRT